ncbi:MAG: hypothetical protein ACRERU_12795 [Methylococcales bacterium]
MHWMKKVREGLTGGGRQFKGPVGWLLGRQLLAGLKFIAIYSLFGPKLDPKDWMCAEPIKLHENESENGEFWFDYIADSGDGQKAVYNIAYLCQGDLWIRTGGGKGRVELTQSADFSKLPRGRFLFVGGDTAYHISDYETICERFRDPFNWAFKSREANEGKSPDRRPIVAIPANHDYYDSIDGFNRQFRRPVVSLDDSGLGPQLDLDGFYRVQDASYVAIKLPFDWWLWGLDSQNGAIDFRQREFFRNLCGSHSSPRENANDSVYTPPNKLIVATPEPSTSYRRWTDDQAELVKTFQSLGLDCAFLERNDGRLSDPDSQCRLDLSGDIHHYARYWGRGADRDRTLQARDNYASVVAGGGGAFLHPTHTHGAGITESRLYPDLSQSLSLFVSRLLNPWNIARGGYIWAVGGLLALLLYFAGTVPDSTWSLVPIVSDDSRPLSLQATGKPEISILAAIQKDLKVKELKADAQTIGAIPYIPDLLIAATIICLFSYWAKRFLCRTAGHSFEIKNWKTLKKSLGLGALLAIALVMNLIFWIKESIPPPLLASLLGILFIAGGILAVVVNRLYTDLVLARFKSLPDADDKSGDSSRWFSLRYWIETFVNWDYLPSWVLMISAFLSVLFGLWRYGIYKAAVTFSDSVFIVVLALVVVGLLAYATKVGAAGLDRRARLSMLLIGIWHLFLQLTTPVSWVAHNDALTTVLVLVTVVAATMTVGFAVPRLVNQYPQFGNQEWIARFLTLCWLVIGIGCLAFAFAGTATTEVSTGRMAGAFITGTIFSCVWFGWYLAVSSTYRGHYNEAGGGARADRYRHMIRFKLEPDRLTGYVIGIDRPVSDFDPKNLPTFELVDVFCVGVSKK